VEQRDILRVLEGLFCLRDDSVEVVERNLRHLVAELKRFQMQRHRDEVGDVRDEGVLDGRALSLMERKGESVETLSRKG
jgi:hypothetical protein